MYNDDFYTSLPEAFTSLLQTPMGQLGMNPLVLPTSTLLKQITQLGMRFMSESSEDSIHNLISHFGQLSTINTNQIDVSSIIEPLFEISRSIDIASLLSSVPNEDDIEDIEDYIITDSHVIREINLSDGIAIPVGNNKIKMKTGDFIAFLTFILTIFTLAFPHTNKETLSGSKAEIQNMTTLPKNETSSSEDTGLLLEQTRLLQEQNRLLQEQNRFTRELNQLTQEQNQVLWEQNQVLLEILESVDTSMSSQAEFFKDMEESLQEQAVLFQMHPESSVAVQESEDSTREATDLIQKAGDPTQPTADTSPSTPSTGYDNE